MNTIQHIANYKLEIIAILQLILLVILVLYPNDVYGFDPASASANCSTTSCGSGNCSIVLDGSIGECDGAPDPLCWASSSTCQCVCACGTMIMEEGPNGPEPVFNGQFQMSTSCSIA